VLDFGISRPMAHAAPASSSLTRVGEVVGTPEYMSPEQASGDVVDGRSDLYSLGLTAYYAATGHTAVTGESTQKILVRQLTERVPPVESLRPDLPPALASAIDRCVEKDPADRFPTAESLVEEIDAAQLTEPEIPLAIRLFAGELSTLALAAAVILALMWSAVETQLHANMALLDTMLPVAAFLGILVTRTLTTMSEGRRLAVAGYSAGDVMEGMRRVMAERATRREELRADPETQRRRTATVRWGAGLLVMSIIFIRIAFAMRVQTGPNRFSTPAAGVALVFSGVALFGTSLVLLLKSPFRMPPGERIFRLLWLGPIGRGFVRLSMRGAHAGKRTLARVRTAPHAHVAIVAPATAPASPSASASRPMPAAPVSLASLEARVGELERWRRRQGE
jgi:eukaryotic-like serine/threonine-protein kinase